MADHIKQIKQRAENSKLYNELKRQQEREYLQHIKTLEDLHI